MRADFSYHIYYLESPEGRKFRSRNELRQYLEKHNLEYNAEDFDFSIWGRGNRPPAKSSTAAAAVAAAAAAASTTSGASSQPPPPGPPPTMSSGDGTTLKKMSKTGTQNCFFFICRTDFLKIAYFISKSKQYKNEPVSHYVKVLFNISISFISSSLLRFRRSTTTTPRICKHRLPPASTRRSSRWTPSSNDI